MEYRTIYINTEQHNALHYNTMQCTTIQCSTSVILIQYSYILVQYNSIQNTTQCKWCCVCLQGIASVFWIQSVQFDAVYSAMMCHVVWLMQVRFQWTWCSDVWNLCKVCNDARYTLFSFCSVSKFHHQLQFTLGQRSCWSPMLINNHQQSPTA